MISGILAGTFFLIWGWLGYKVVTAIPRRPGLEPWKDEPWRERVAGGWLLSMFTYVVAGGMTADACGTLGDLLLFWAVLTLLSVLGIGGVLLLSIVVGSAGSKAVNGAIAAYKKVAGEDSPPPGLTYAQLGIGFLAFCGWLGSLPNPNCEAEVIQAMSVESALSELADHNPEMAAEIVARYRDEIEAVIAEHHPQDLPSFDRMGVGEIISGE